MTDYIRTWRFRGWRVQFCFRRFHEASLRRWGLLFEREMNGQCYCPEGFWLRLEMPIGIIWFDGDRVRRPCSCDEAIHDVLHDGAIDCCAVGELKSEEQ